MVKGDFHGNTVTLGTTSALRAKENLAGPSVSLSQTPLEAPAPLPWKPPEGPVRVASVEMGAPVRGGGGCFPLGPFPTRSLLPKALLAGDPRLESAWNPLG